MNFLFNEKQYAFVTLRCALPLFKVYIAMARCYDILYEQVVYDVNGGFFILFGRCVWHVLLFH